jgi:hypothetical protein
MVGNKGLGRVGITGQGIAMLELMGSMSRNMECTELNVGIGEDRHISPIAYL